MGITVTPKADGAERYQGHINTTRRDGTPFRKSTWLDLHTAEPIHTYAKAVEVATAWASERMPTARMGRDDTLAEMLEEFVEVAAATMQVRPATARAYRSRYRSLIVNDPIARMRPADVTLGDLQDLRARLLEDGNAPSYVLATEQALSSAFTWMVGRGVTASNPVRLLEPMRGARAPRPRSLTNAELAEVGAWVAVHRHSDSIWVRSFCLAVRIALMTGMRAGEICAITADSFDAGNCLIAVEHSVTSVGGHAGLGKTKGGRSREVIVPPDLARDMDGHMADVETLFGDRRARPLPLVTATGRFVFGTQISEAFSGLRDELGLSKEVTFHKLRHTHATRLVRAGASAKEVQRRLGHADVKTTLDFYYDTDPAEGRRMAALAGQAMGGYGL